MIVTWIVRIVLVLVFSVFWRSIVAELIKFAVIVGIIALVATIASHGATPETAQWIKTAALGFGIWASVALVRGDLA